MIEDKRIAILGGTGSFGQHMAKMLESKNEIVITGSTLEKAERIAEQNGWNADKNKTAVEDADIVIVSVPISLTVDTIEEVGPHVSDEALLCDVTSVKEEPCEAMEGFSNQVLGMHPMYGPSTTPEGQNVILCPVEGEEWEKMEEFWREKGAEIHVTDPESHDTAVSVVQALTHFTEFAFIKAVQKSGMSEEELEKYATPHFEMIKDLAARTLNQKPELYQSIQDSSSRNEERIEEMIESVQEVAELVEEVNLEKLFKSGGADFETEAAEEKTDRVIEFLNS